MCSSDLDLLAFSGKHMASLDPSTYNFDVEWFASTKSAKGFHQMLADLPGAFDDAISNIPLEGDVALGNYQQFVIAYLSAFSRGKPFYIKVISTRIE